MNVKEEIKAAIKNGIYMGFKDDEEEKIFFKALFSFLIKKKNFCIYKDNEQTIVVSSDVEDLCEIFIHAGTLKLVPFTSHGVFNVFMDMLEFIAKRHGEEITELEKKVNNDPDDDESTEEEEWWL